MQVDLFSAMARLIQAFVISGIWLGLAAGQADNKSPDVNQIIEESAQASERDLNARLNYEYSETDLQPDGSRKTYAVYMLSGSPYEELTAINGHPLSRDQREQEERKLSEETSRRLHESAEDRAKRLEQFEKEQKRDRRFIQEFTHAFNFKLIREQMLNHRRVYVVQATPRSGFHPTDAESKVLTGMRGTLWIDAATRHWVKAQAEVIHPVSIEGFLATVEPGTRFILENMPVGGGVWLPTHYSMTADAKILLFIPHRNREDERYFNYHPASQSQATPHGQSRDSER